MNSIALARPLIAPRCARWRCALSGRIPAFSPGLPGSGFLWTGYWSFEPEYTRHEPLQIPNIFFCSTATMLMLAGLALMWQRRREWILPYFAVLGAYPAVYYITHPTMDYRHPIDPMLVILIAYAVVSFRERRYPSGELD